MKKQDKTAYVAPITEILCVKSEHVMITASPGVGGEYGEGDPIDSKESSLGMPEDVRAEAKAETLPPKSWSKKRLLCRAW